MIRQPVKQVVYLVSFVQLSKSAPNDFLFMHHIIYQLFQIDKFLVKMERFGGDRLESVDMFADSGEKDGDFFNAEEDDMFDEGDELELLQALEHTGEFDNEMEMEEEVRYNKHA